MPFGITDPATLAAGKATTSSVPVPTAGLVFLFDGNHAYTDAGAATLCSVNASDTCQVLKDLSGNTNNLVQATSGTRPVWYASGQNSKPYIYTNGSSTWISSASFIWNDPVTVYMVLRQHWLNVGVLWSSLASAGHYRYVVNLTTPSLIYMVDDTQGGNLANDDLTDNTWGLAMWVYNGASSLGKMNNAASVTGARSTSSGPGFQLGVWDVYPGSADFAEVVGYSVAHDPASGDGLLVRQYLNTKYNLGLGI